MLQPLLMTPAYSYLADGFIESDDELLWLGVLIYGLSGILGFIV